MEKYLYNLILHLREHHEIILLVPTTFNITIDKVKIYHYYQKKIPIMDTMSVLVSQLFVLPALLMRERPQIISAFIPSFASAVSFFIAKLFRMKTIVNLRGTWDFNKKLLIAMGSLGFLFTDAIIMNSKHLHQVYHKQFPLPKSIYRGIPNYFLPNAINTTYWAPKATDQSDEEKSFDLVFVANLHNSLRIYKKGFKVLYDALEIIRTTHSKTLRVKMIGRSDVAAITKEIGPFNEEYFSWAGVIYDKGVLKLTVQQASLFVLSSNVEGMPNSLMEAMSLSMPSVATEVGAVRELISDGENGFVVPMEDPDALAEKIWILLNDKELQKEFSKKSREKMIHKFGWAHNVELIENFYQNLIDK